MRFYTVHGRFVGLKGPCLCIAVEWSCFTRFACLQPFSVVKFTILQDTSVEGMSDAALNVIETSFLALYAVGQFAVGPAGDRFGARPMLAAAFLVSALCTAACGYMHSAVGLAVVWGINGLLQVCVRCSRLFTRLSFPPTCVLSRCTVATLQGGVFPLNMKALSPWLDPASRGAVLGVWTTCQQVGCRSSWAGNR